MRLFRLSAICRKVSKGRGPLSALPTASPGAWSISCIDIAKSSSNVAVASKTEPRAPTTTFKAGVGAAQAGQKGGTIAFAHRGDTVTSVAIICGLAKRSARMTRVHSDHLGQDRFSKGRDESRVAPEPPAALGHAPDSYGFARDEWLCAGAHTAARACDIDARRNANARHEALGLDFPGCGCGHHSVFELFRHIEVSSRQFSILFAETKIRLRPRSFPILLR